MNHSNLLRIFVAVLALCSALTAQRAQSKQAGTVVLASGDSKPFTHLASIDSTPIDIDNVKVRYGAHVEELFGRNAKKERLPELSLKGVKQIDLLPYSKEEQAEINRIATGCVNTDACSVRKVSFTFSDGKKQAGVLVDVEFFRYAIGPNKEKYSLSDYDVAGVKILR